MPAVLRFRIICFALILFGSFANFAQNLWGNNLITIMELVLALSFLAQAIKILLNRIKANQLRAFNVLLMIFIAGFFLFPFAGMLMRGDMARDAYIWLILAISVLMLVDIVLKNIRSRKKRDYVDGLHENYFLFFVIIGFFFRNMRWPGSGELLLMGITMLIPFYISKTISFIRHEFKKGPLLVTLLSIGSFATVVLGAGLLFKRMHWPGGNLLVLTGFVLTGILIAGSIKWRYNFNNESLTIIKALKLLKTQIVPVYFALFIFCFHAFLANLNMAPKFYSTIRPAAIEKLRNGTPKGENDSWKLAEMYDRFVEVSEKNGFVK